MPDTPFEPTNRYGQVSLSEVDRLANSALKSSRLNVAGGTGLQESAAGFNITDLRLGKIYIQLTGGGTGGKYSWTRAVATSSTTFVPCGDGPSGVFGGVPAVELSLNPNIPVDGTVFVEATADPVNICWRFQYLGGGPSCCSGTVTNPPVVGGSGGVPPPIPPVTNGGGGSLPPGVGSVPPVSTPPGSTPGSGGGVGGPPVGSFPTCPPNTHTVLLNDGRIGCAPNRPGSGGNQTGLPPNYGNLPLQPALGAPIPPNQNQLPGLRNFLGQEGQGLYGGSGLLSALGLQNGTDGYTTVWNAALGSWVATPLPAVLGTLTTTLATTTNNTTTTVATLTLSNNHVYDITINIIGVDTGNGDVVMFAYKNVFHCKSGTAGTVPFSTPVNNTLTTDNGATSAAFTLSTNTVLLKVTGDTGRTFHWKVSSIVNQVS